MIRREWLCAERGPVVPDVAIWNRGSDQDLGVLTYCEDLTRRPKAEWATAAYAKTAVADLTCQFRVDFDP